MKKLSFSGIVLLGLGVVFIFLSTVQIKTREEVFRVGNVSASATTSKKHPTFRYAGVACLGAGVAILALGFFRRR